MSAHLRLLSAAAATLIPAPASLHRLRLRLPAPPLPAARLRALRLPRLEERPRCSRAAVRCSGSAVARVGEDGDGQAGAGAGAGIWEQVRDIVVFAGPALGLWICGPLMSLIDTMVVGQTNALQLAALGPGTVFCDYLSYIFMFLSVATSNMVATSLAKKNTCLGGVEIPK